MERLWFNATLRVCADGAINRLYSTFDSDAERARFIPEYVRGDLDSVEDKVQHMLGCDMYARTRHTPSACSDSS